MVYVFCLCDFFVYYCFFVFCFVFGLLVKYGEGVIVDCVFVVEWYFLYVYVWVGVEVVFVYYWEFFGFGFV